MGSETLTTKRSRCSYLSLVFLAITSGLTEHDKKCGEFFLHFKDVVDVDDDVMTNKAVHNINVYTLYDIVYLILFLIKLE